MKAFIIHLSKVPASYESGIRLQNELQNFNIHAKLFEGSYGNETLKKYNRIGRRHHPWNIKGPKRLCGDDFIEKYHSESNTKLPGIVGCFDSHYRLWKHSVKIQEPIMIFEDDAQIIREYIPVDFEEVLSLASSHFKKTKKYINYLENPKGQPEACRYKPISMPGAAGYALKPNAAKKLTKMYSKTFLPADNAINQHVVKIQIHNYMMGKAIYRTKTGNNSSLIKTKYWSKNA